MSQKKFHLFSVQGRNSGKKDANFFAREEDSMTSVDSNFHFLCERPHGAGPPSPLHMCPPEPDPLPPPCGRHKWMAPYILSTTIISISLFLHLVLMAPINSCELHNYYLVLSFLLVYSSSGLSTDVSS